ncbi:MAG: hypothetical protein GKR96_14365 [Gammaproteobacteria bacterium]|nr:hypothetical protein [Gammaproteobacteria bacterium]
MIFRGNSQIMGSGSFVPKTVVSSVDLLDELHSEARFGIQSTWMDDALGIKTRHYCDDSARPSDIAVLAAQEAIEDAGIDVLDIDAIIYCGITGDFIEPGTAHIIQHKIGARNAICKDVSNACHGFCDGMLFADLMIGGGIENALVVTAELTKVSRLFIPLLEKEKDVNKFSYSMGALSVGDAAGAMILSKKTDPERGIEVINTVSDGQYNDLCSYDIVDGQIEGGMVMERISYIGVRQCAKQLPATLEAFNNENKTVTNLVMHQVGKKPYEAMIKIASRALKYRPENIPKTFDRLGNITTATIPLNYDLLRKSGKMDPGEKMMFVGNGSGHVLTWFGLTI